MNYKEIYDRAFAAGGYNANTLTAKVLQPSKDMLLDALEQNDVTSVIDIGCGKGHYLQFIQAQYPEIKLFSIDIGKYHTLDDIPFLEMDITTEAKWELKDHFDLIFCHGVLEHIEEKYLQDIFKWFAQISTYTIIMVANHADGEYHITMEKSKFWTDHIEPHLEILQFEHTNDVWYFYKLKSRSDDG